MLSIEDMSGLIPCLLLEITEFRIKIIYKDDKYLNPNHDLILCLPSLVIQVVYVCLAYDTVASQFQGQ